MPELYDVVKIGGGGLGNKKVLVGKAHIEKYSSGVEIDLNLPPEYVNGVALVSVSNGYSGFIKNGKLTITFSGDFQPCDLVAMVIA